MASEGSANHRGVITKEGKHNKAVIVADMGTKFQVQTKSQKKPKAKKKKKNNLRGGFKAHNMCHSNISTYTYINMNSTARK